MAFLAGQVPTADELNELIPTRVVKSAATSRSSTTTVAADPDLTVTLAASTTYRWRAVMRISGDGGDFKCNWDTPSGTSMVQRTCVGPQAATTDVTNTAARLTSGHAAGTEITYGTTTANGLAIEEGLVTTSSTAGAFTLRWAQGTTDTDATSLGAGSFLEVYKVL